MVLAQVVRVVVAVLCLKKDFQQHIVLVELQELLVKETLVAAMLIQQAQK
jgi:hypothetical protein